MKHINRHIWLSGLFLIITINCYCYVKKTLTSSKNDFEATSLQDIPKTIKLNEMKVTWLGDNTKEKLMPTSLFKDVPDTIIKQRQLQNGIPASISAFLVQTEGKNILFDTGNGFTDSRLLINLQKAGLSANDIQYIYLTHLHGDHIGGMIKDGKAVFTQSEVYVSKTEYDAWINTPSDKNLQQKQIMSIYKEKLHFFESGDTLPGHIVSIDAKGHTPGHTAYQKGRLLIIGDLIHGAAIQFDFPEICASFDMDKNKAIQTRKLLLKQAKEDKLIIAGMHLPSPAFKVE